MSEMCMDIAGSYMESGNYFRELDVLTHSAVKAQTYLF